MARSGATRNERAVLVEQAERVVPNQSDCVQVAEMLTGIAIVIFVIEIGIPLGAIIGVRMMALMKCRVVHRLSGALHARHEQGNH